MENNSRAQRAQNSGVLRETQMKSLVWLSQLSRAVITYKGCKKTGKFILEMKCENMAYWEHSLVPRCTVSNQVFMCACAKAER